MTKEELFKKYNINENHNTWNPAIDSWMSVEVYRLMHNGELPSSYKTNHSVLWITQFLDRTQSDTKWWLEIMQTRSDWGSLFLTAKRMVSMHHENIIDELRRTSSGQNMGDLSHD